MKNAPIFLFVGLLVLIFLYKFSGENFDYNDFNDGYPEPTDAAHAPMLHEAPYQASNPLSPFRYKKGTLEPLYDFVVTARLISKEYYSTDNGADFSPVDLGLGWGRMANPIHLAQIEFKQSGRFLRWRWQKLPIPQKELESSVANMHILPSDELVESDIDQLRAGDVVKITGKLVNVHGDDGYRWRTSTTRTDTGNGACEVFFVESVTVL